MSRTEGDSDRERWERVQSLLGEALELAGAEREAFLASACEGDEALRAEVESLLDAAEASDVYFGELAGRAGITLSDNTLDAPDASDSGDTLRRSRGRGPELIGTRVGQYDVLEFLGRGGMASVYLAEREGEGFTQRVALKVVSRRVSDPLIQRRSNEERRILARLEHRGIARLIDGGVTPDGFPFYAMEFVEGTDVVTYCDEHRLGIDDRIRLFLEVCAPVQFAHERLVVHCDLKPSNIYVTPEGHVKLLDFGVARLIDPEAVGDEVTGLWFTPAYASPEQVRRQRPGTHSDVYSLGVLLYEMLTGSRPYRFASDLREDIARTVGEIVPPRPSEVVVRPSSGAMEPSAVHDLASEIAASRSSSTSELRRRLKGDLDAIVMRALAKDPEERYRTADQLAADLRRHLQHQIVASVPPTPAYRFSKFVRRNRAAVSTSALVLLAVVVGVAATLWQASRATRAAQLAVEEADKAALVAEVMSDLFRLSDPTETLGDTASARDVLDRGTERIQAAFGDQPSVQADLLTDVARVYRNLGQYDRAAVLVSQALELRVEEFGGLSAEASESMVHLGVLRSEMSRPNEAAELLSRAVDIREDLVPRPDSLLIEAKAALAWVVRDAGSYEQAAQLFDDALTEQLLIDPQGRRIPDLRFGLAASYHDNGMLDEADAMFQELLAGVDTTERPTPQVISALERVGMVRRLREQYEEAEPLLAAAAAMGVRLWGPEHSNALSAQQEHGLNLVGLGRWEEAERLFRAGVETSTRSLGPQHSVTARLQEGLGAVLEDLGRYDEAAEYQKLSLQEKVLRHQNRDHPGVVASLVSVARALALGGRNSESLDYLTQADAMNRRLGEDRSVYAISAHRSRGIMAAGEGDALAAEAHFLQAIELAEELLPRRSHRFRLGAMNEYATMLMDSGRPDEAVPVLEEVLSYREASLPDPHPLTERTRRLLRAARAN